MQHNLYLSGISLKAAIHYRKLFPDAELNALLSYGTRSSDYFQMINSEHNIFNSIIADSGAFTKYFSKSASSDKISLPGYIEFLKQTYQQFDYCMNYDREFLMNGFDTNTPMMELIESNGFQVVPVIHDYIGEERHELDYYIDKKYPIIALGFSEHKKKNKIKNIKVVVKKALAAGMKIHLLGLTSLNVFNEIPAHYSDSSSWSQYTKYGLTLWLKKEQDKITEEKFSYKDSLKGQSKNHEKYLIDTHPLKDEFLKYVKDELDITSNNLFGQERSHYRDLVNIHYFVNMQNEVRLLHQNVITRPEWAPYFSINTNITETMKGDFDQDFLNDVNTLLDI
jgi:hypothetical protein